MFPPSPHMQRALLLAQEAGSAGEVPVGAVLTGPDGEVLAEAANATRARNDPTAHAEILVIRAAALRLGADRLVSTTLWVTLEPCAMCAGAIAWARIGRLVYGAPDPKGGAVESGPRLFGSPTIHHRPEIIGGVFEAQAAALLREFFVLRRPAGAGAGACASAYTIAGLNPLLADE